MKKILLTLILVLSIVEVVGQQIQRNPFKVLYRSGRDATLTQYVNRDDKNLKGQDLFIVSIPEAGLEEYNNVSFSATMEKMTTLLKVLVEGDFNDGDYINDSGVKITYHVGGMFSVGKTTAGIHEVGIIERQVFEKMYEIMMEIKGKQADPAL